MCELQVTRFTRHRHDGQAVTCDNICAAMEKANCVDLGLFEVRKSEGGRCFSGARVYQLTNSTAVFNVTTSFARRQRWYLQKDTPTVMYGLIFDASTSAFKPKLSQSTSMPPKVSPSISLSP